MSKIEHTQSRKMLQVWNKARSEENMKSPFGVKDLALLSNFGAFPFFLI